MPAPVTSYSDRSDDELTALAASWDTLDRLQRRALLTEMKLRMARRGERKDVLHIRTERRYGRLIRQPDGRVIRIETQVVHVRPVQPEELAAARKGFGVGFEQRVGRADGSTAPAEPSDPALQAADAAASRAAARSLETLLEALERSPPPRSVEPLPMHRVADPGR